MRVDHIGYAVKDMERARKAFEALGYVFEDIVVDEARNVYICFGEDDSQRIELVSPISQGSPVDEVLNKMGGGTPYHICYQVSSLDDEAKRLRAAGYKVILPSAPAVAFHGRKVVFLYHLAIGIIEMVETEEEIRRDSKAVCAYPGNGGVVQDRIQGIPAKEQVVS